MTLRLRLALIYGLLASLALTLALVVGFGFYERAAFRSADGTFALLTRQSATNFLRYGVLEPPPFTTPVTLRLFDPQGNLLENVGSENAPALDPLTALTSGVPAHPAWVSLLPSVSATPASYQGLGLVTLEGVRWRSYTMTLEDDRLLQLIASLENTDLALSRVRRNFGVLGLLGVALVFLVGYALSGTSLRPLTELASDTKELLHTQNITLPTTLHGVTRESLESRRGIPSHDDLAFLSNTITNTTTFLSEERERLDLALQAAHMGWWEWDAVNDLHRWSPEFERLLGLEPGEFRGGVEAFLGSVHPDDKERVRFLAERASTTRPSMFEYRVLLPDGKVRWIESRAQAVQDERGRMLRLLGIDTDISERKRSQENLRYAADVLESVSEAIISTDLEGRIQSWNKGAEETYGYTSSEAVGQTVTNLLQTEFTDENRQSSRGELALTGKWRGEVVQIHKEGRRLEISSSVRFQRDTTGNNVGMVAANRDISERKQAEERLRFLNDASLLLVSSLDLEATLRGIAQSLVPRLADWCSITLPNAEGKLEAIEIAHASPERLQLVRDLGELYPEDPSDPNSNTQLMQTGRSLLVPTVTDELLVASARDERHLELLRKLELGSALIVPMMGSREAVGLIGLGMTSGHRTFDQNDVLLAEELGRRAAIALENAHLYQKTRTSEERFRAVQQTTPDGFMMFESLRAETGKIVDFRWLLVNPAAETMVGRNESDLLGKRLLVEMPGNREEGLFDAYVRVVETGEPWQREFSYAHEGINKWFRSTAVKTEDGFAVSFADITESKTLLADLRVNEERFRSLVQASAQLVWSTDSKGFNAEPQQSWLSFTGQRWEDEQGWGWLNAIHEDDRERVRASWSRAVETKTMYVERERLRRHDGVYRHMDVRAVPVFAKDGSVREWVGTHTDVTERVLASEALSESEERYRTLVMASNQAVFTADRTGRSTGAEAVWSSLTGQSPEEARRSSDSWLEAVHPDDRPSVEKIWREALRERRGYEFTYKTAARGNKRRHIAVRTVPRFSANGEFLEYIGAFTDITEGRQLELDNEFLANISELLRSATDAETLLPTMSKTICGYLELPDCFFVEVNEPQERYKLHAGYFSNAPFEAREEPLSLYNPVTLREGKTGHVTVVSSTRADERFSDWYEDHFKPVKLEAFVNVPFLRDGKFVGSFTVASDKAYDWTERELNLIQTVTERTWLTLEKLRVDKELTEQARTLRKQADLLSLANEAVITRTPHSVILSWNEAATELYGYTEGEAVGRNSHDLLQTRFIRSTEESVRQTLLAEEFWQGELEHTTKGGVKLVVLSRQALRRDDDGRPLEIIEINWDITSRKQVEIQREKLLELTQRSEREALALAEIASSFSLAKPFETNLTLIAQRVAQTVGADACAVEIYEDDKKELGLTGSYGYPAGFAEALADVRKGGLETLAQQAIRQGEVIIAKEFVKTTLANKGYTPLHDLVQNQAWGTVVAVPLPVTRYAGGAVVVFYPHGLDPDLTDLLQLSTIVSQIALVVENARLFEDAQGKAALEERQRLARDLHDSVSQALYGISLGANSAKTALSLDSSETKLKEIERSLEYLIYMGDTAMAEMKSLIFELRPESLATEGLVVALRKHLRALELRHRFALQLDLPGEPDVSLEVKEMLYRITQEAMNNVVKHAQAKHVWIRLEVTKERLELEVRDDGHGFDTNREFPGHLGLRSMRERAEKLGASYRISSKLGEGTTVHVLLPLD
jgi:PAS domain S-box-containing protein